MIEPGQRREPNAGTDAVVMYPDSDPGVRTVDVPGVADDADGSSGEDGQARLESAAHRADDAVRRAQDAAEGR